MVELTEKLLAEAGGWQAMKHARALNEAGRVSEAAYQPPILTGLVREGQVEYRAGLKITTAKRVENLCRCREAQRWGKICAHSLAVGLAIIRPRPAETPPAAAGHAPRMALRPADGLRLSAEGQGERLVLHVVLPPILRRAWERESITIGFEAELNPARRVLLDAIPKDRPFTLEPRDLAIVERIRELNAGIVTGMLVLAREPFLELLDLLKNHPRVSFGRTASVSVEAEPSRAHLEIKNAEAGEKTVSVRLPEGSLRAGSRVWLLAENTLRPVVEGLPLQYAALLSAPVTLASDHADPFLAAELPALRHYFEIEGLETAEPPARADLPVPSIQLELEGSLNHLTARITASYDGSRIQLGVPSAVPNVRLRRNVRMEREAMERLMERGFSAPDRAGILTLRTERAILSFFATELPRLQREWMVTVGSRFRNVTAGVERMSPEVRIQGSGTDWFSLEVELKSSGGERFRPADIKKLLQSGQRHFRLRSGRLAVFDGEFLDEFETVLADCNPAQVSPGRYRIHQIHSGYLAATLENEPGVSLRAEPAWNRTGQPDEVDPAALGDLDTVLRPYQKQGVAWMCFLASRAFGGILADEMGLGKTLQALAFVRRCRLGGDGRPCLVVCPASLVYNWQREASRFTPELRVIAVEGSGRSQALRSIGNADLIITSYPLLRRDIGHYLRHRFGTVILDEAQHIKNPDTQNAQAASALKSETRFVLTGTPVENSVRDLWSIMNFVLPGYLGERDDFKTAYEAPIAKDSAAPELGRLKRRLKPFLMRRLKKEVYAELPDKIEQVTYCELTADQSELYTKLLIEGRTELAQLAAAKGSQGKVHLTALNILLRLRQVCCTPALLGFESASSGKLDLLEELLEEIVDGVHKVLIFSQFVSVLRILCVICQRRQIPFAYLDGATKHRADEVDRFQNSPEVGVFLISLKAGGTGLNLTAADTVIHFDPWWNPAVEAQATDRAHRIGQQRTVTSYKLITRGTVEEKILELQRRKRALIEATVESEEPLMTGLGTEEIRELLE